MVRISYIYADNCEHCEDALSTIESSIQKCKNIACEIAKFQYDSKAALAIAMAQGIDTLPGFVIGNEVFKGDDYNLDNNLDHLLRQDTLKEDMVKLFGEKYRKSIMSFKKRNKSKHRGYQHYYTPELRALVEQRENILMRLFRYEF